MGTRLDSSDSELRSDSFPLSDSKLYAIVNFTKGEEQKAREIRNDARCRGEILLFGETLTRRNLSESLLLGEKIDGDGDEDEAAIIVAEELRASMA